MDWANLHGRVPTRLPVSNGYGALVVRQYLTIECRLAQVSGKPRYLVLAPKHGVRKPHKLTVWL